MARIKYTDLAKSQKKSPEPIDEPTPWKPTAQEVEKYAKTYAVSKFVKLSSIPDDADIYTGENVPGDTLILSLSHLRFISFPIHPVFQLVWRVLGLHPMQLHPNAYLFLSSFLIMGWKWGVSLGLSDFLHLFNCVRTGKLRYFNFSPYPKMKIFAGVPISHPGWRSKALMISGKWRSPELDLLPPAAFADDLAYKLSPAKIDLPSGRVAWLESHLVGGDWCPSQFVTIGNLAEVASVRPSALFGRYREPVDSTLSGRELALRVAQIESVFSRSECCEALFATYAEVKSDFRATIPCPDATLTEGYGVEGNLDEEEEFQVNTIEEEPLLHAVRDLPHTIPPPRRFKKRKAENLVNGSESSYLSVEELAQDTLPPPLARGDSSFTQLLQPLLETARDASAQNVILPQANPPASNSPSSSRILELSFKKRDSSFVLAEEPLLSNGPAASAVAATFASLKPIPGPFPKSPMDFYNDLCASQLDALMASHQFLRSLDGLHSKQQQKLEDVNSQLKDKDRQLLAKEHEIEEQSQVMAELGLIVEEKNHQIAQLKTELAVVMQSKDEEYQKGVAQIKRVSAKNFRLGWNQALTKEEDRCYPSPDEFDRYYGFIPSGYSPIRGMIPGDVPSPVSSGSEGHGIDDGEASSAP